MQKSVLLADDDERALAVVARALGMNGGWRLLLARDGEEALTIAQREKPDLALLDVEMPKVHGYEVCAALKRDLATSHIRVILLSGLEPESAKRRALEVGADAFVPKPFLLGALRDRVAEVLQLS